MVKLFTDNGRGAIQFSKCLTKERVSALSAKYKWIRFYLPETKGDETQKKFIARLNVSDSEWRIGEMSKRGPALKPVQGRRDNK